MIVLSTELFLIFADFSAICLANYGLAALVSDYLCEGRIWFSGYSTVVLPASFVSEAATSQATSDLTGDG